ncbi:UBX domain-containing protein 7-like [Anopheles albimanus]|uniref:UAS domain-containing protein n=1 Tax=Anopheles albimanus TaxID=7167 RepID=A0A182FNB9_ANOAL|nr:UBX domain-containing protein 7-like [Anopheles albimanus]
MAEDNVKSLSEITGLKEEQATNLLAAYNGNLEGAINAFFENPEGILNPEPAVVIDDDSSSSGPSGAALGSGSSASAFLHDDDNVRAPIPRKTEILLPQIESNRARIGKRRAVITEVPFRNFELEGRIQEQMLLEGEGPSAKKITRLEALFMPPFEILFSGGFDLAQRHGRSLDRWLLVNLQDDLNFCCQMLNRDLWSDARLKEFMRRNLVFWQQSNKTNDGAKFKTFYKVRSEPYIAMIDPRTGEEVQNFSTTDLTPGRFLEALKEFLVEHKSPQGKEVNVNIELSVAAAGPSTSTNGPKLGFGGPRASSSSTSTSAGNKQQSTGDKMQRKDAVKTSTWPVADEDEDEFQEITDSDSDDCEEVVVPAARATATSKVSDSLPIIEDAPAQISHPAATGSPPPERAGNGTDHLDDTEALAASAQRSASAPNLSSDSESSLAPDQKTRIMLKMPGNVTERLFFRSSRTLQHAMAKLLQRYKRHFSDRATDTTTDVRFFCQAIKADLASLDSQQTLLELKIHPNAVIHVTTDD